MKTRLSPWLLALCFPLLLAAKSTNVRFTYSELQIYRDELMPLLDTIASGEGEYYSINRGRAGDSLGDWAKENLGQSITTMTIAEVRSHQGGKRSSCWYKGVKGTANLFAVGRYQLIPCTLQYATQEIKDLDMEMLYEPKVQDAMGVFLLLVKRPAVRDYLAGIHNDHQRAGQELAKEFASIPIQYSNGRCNRGQSYYCGDKAGNKAIVSLEDIDAVLKKTREAMMKDGELYKHITGTELKRKRRWWQRKSKRSFSSLDSLEHTLFDFVFRQAIEEDVQPDPAPKETTTPPSETEEDNVKVKDITDPRIVPKSQNDLDEKTKIGQQE